MQFKIKNYFSWFLLISSYAYGLTIIPDSVLIKNITIESEYNPIGNVELKNERNLRVTVDSIKIRFLNGDSSDFRKGIDFRPNQFWYYFRQGWVYGVIGESLGYLKDSLFLLQDTSGNPVSFSIDPKDSSVFILYLIECCPYCSSPMTYRPKTTDIIYLFCNSSGKTDSLKVRIQFLTALTDNKIQPYQSNNRSLKSDEYNLAGRKLGKKGLAHMEIVLDKKVILINR